MPPTCSNLFNFQTRSAPRGPASPQLGGCELNLDRVKGRTSNLATLACNTHVGKLQDIVDEAHAGFLPLLSAALHVRMGR